MTKKVARATESLAVGRLAHALPFVRALARIGAPVEKGLRTARLPVESADPNLIVPVHCMWSFAEVMARREGIEDLGLEASFEIDGTFLAGPLRTRILSAPNLMVGLRRFTNHCLTESNRTTAGLTQQKDSAQFWHLGAFDDHPGLEIMEVYFVMAQLALMRLFLGPRWQPPVIGLQGPQVSRRARELLPDTRFLTGQPLHFIQFPRTLLSWPAPKRSAPGQGQADHGAQKPPTGVADMLASLLESYIPDGSPTIQSASELMGLSKRTLQRRLREMGLTYSSLLDQTRYGIAARMIKDPSVKLHEVAHFCGYEDPSHFSRAFRRLAGVSPSEYRQINRPSEYRQINH
jgi:AraC-like DNA-binding protein